MTSSLPFIIYIHGFNSSPASAKARQFTEACRQRGNCQLAVPELSHDPQQAITQLEALVAAAGDNLQLLVGSSLGGYYATWLAEKFDCRAALVNPAVSPVKNLGEAFLGRQKNLYTGVEYDFTREHAMYLDTLDINPLQKPENFLLLAQTGDAVLDYRLAAERYAGSEQVIEEGGSHRFEGFERMFPAIFEFAETGRLSTGTRQATVSAEAPDSAQRKKQKA